MYLTKSEFDFLNELSLFLWSIRYSETLENSEDLERFYRLLSRLLDELNSRQNRANKRSYEHIKEQRKVDKNYARPKNNLL